MNRLKGQLLTGIPQPSHTPMLRRHIVPTHGIDFVVTLLRRDHEKVSSLFNQIQGGLEHPDTPERHRSFRQLKRELDLHAAVEDLHVYRVFQQAEPARDGAHEALEAHSKIKMLPDEPEDTCGQRGKRDISQDRGGHDAARSRGTRCDR